MHLGRPFVCTMIWHLWLHKIELLSAPARREWLPAKVDRTHANVSNASCGRRNKKGGGCWGTTHQLVMPTVVGCPKSPKALPCLMRASEGAKIGLTNSLISPAAVIRIEPAAQRKVGGFFRFHLTDDKR